MESNQQHVEKNVNYIDNESNCDTSNCDMSNDKNKEDNNILIKCKMNFVTLKEAIQKIDYISSTNIIMRFKNGSTALIGINDNKTILSFIKLYTFDTQTCQNNTEVYDICVSLVQLKKFLNNFYCGQKDGTYYSSQFETELCVYKNSVSKTYINLTDDNGNVIECLLDNLINNEKINLPTDSSFDYLIIINIKTFIRICETLQKISKYCKIECNEKFLNISTHTNEHNISFKLILGNSIKIIKLSTFSDNIVQMFSIGNILTIISDFPLLTEEIELFIKDGCPMFINCDVDNVGKFLYGVSPIN